MQSYRNTFWYLSSYFILNISGVISNGKAHIALKEHDFDQANMHNIYNRNLLYIYNWFLNITIMIKIICWKFLSIFFMKTPQIFLTKICFKGPLFDCLFQGPDFISCFL